MREYAFKGKYIIDVECNVCISESHPDYDNFDNSVQGMQKDWEDLKNKIIDELGLENENYSDEFTALKLTVNVSNEKEYEKIK